MLDIVSRAIAIAACAGFWWLWLTLDIWVTLGIAGSARKLDVSPSVILAGLALFAIVLLIGGLFAIQGVFPRAYSAAMSLMTFVVKHRRSIAASIRRTVIFTVKLSVIGLAIVVGIGAYVQALSWAMTLTVMTADQVDSLPAELGPDAIAIWLATFARMYIAIGLFAICAAAIYLPARRGLPRRGLAG